MLPSELKSYLVRCRGLLQKQRTLRADEVPKLYHDPGVLTGYRLPGQPMFTYFLSAFQLNNETVNIWTHAFSFGVILFRTLLLLDEFGADDRRVFPLLGFGVCCMLYTSLSVIAHTFHSASPTIHYTCFQADYAGIGLYAFGGALKVFYLSADKQTRTSFSFWFLPVNFISSWLCFLCCCIAKLKYHCPYSRQRKLWQIFPFGLHMLMAMSLVARRASKCYFEFDNCDDRGLSAYGKCVLLAALCALTFSSQLPEKIWPGYFDLIGQSHHMFHLVSLALTLSQFDAAHGDIIHSSPDIIQDSDAIPSLSTILGVIFSLCVCCALTLIPLRSLVFHRIREDESLDKAD